MLRVFISKDLKLVNKLREDAKQEGIDISILYADDFILGKFSEWLDAQPEIGLDIETNHFDPYMGNILLTSISSNTKVFTFDDTVAIEDFLSTKKLNNKTVIAHNLKFETIWFLKHKVHFKKAYCTMLAEQKMLLGTDLFANIIDTFKRRGIEIPPEMNKEIREEFADGTYTKPELHHILYNQADTIKLIELKKIQHEHITRLNLNFLLYNIHFPLIRVLAIAEMEGLVIDEVAFKKLADEAEAKMRVIEDQMEKWIIKTFPNIDLLSLNKPIAEKIKSLENRLIKLEERKIKNEKLLEFYEANNKTHLKAYQITLKSVRNVYQDKRDTDIKLNELYNQNISWGSGKQVISLLEAIGCNPMPKAKDKKTKKFKNSLAKAPRERWLMQNQNNSCYELIKLYNDYMKQTKQVSSFGHSFITKYKHPFTGKFHTSYKQGTVETGRLASGASDQTPAKFNSQQIPRITALRQCFGTDPGYYIATCDLAGAELITMCSLANDLRLLELSKTTDLHSYFANKGWKAIYKSRGLEYTDKDVISTEQNKSKRTDYKPMAFGTIYGLKPPKAAETLNVSEREGAIAIQTIIEEIPDTIKMVEAASAFAIEHGYIIHNNRTYSRRWFPAVINANKTGQELHFLDRASAESAARNTRIQGTQADMLCEAMVTLQRFIDLYKLDAVILMQVHDELVVKFHENYVSWFPVVLKNIMTRTANKYLTKEVRMEAECKVGYTWTK